mgnify:CR=1 FL=1
MLLLIREVTEDIERRVFSPQATLACQSRGRVRPEEECPIRTAFQRDRDRIIHSKAFRRLKHKTQVFIIPEGDHYRTRLTHTLEVAQIARTIARGLRLNEDLTEAIALGHDLGHTPFGHAGEEVLDELHPGGFRHYEQSLRVVDVLEGNGGLNLTWEVRDGIRNHSGDMRPATLEGQVVKISDRIAYINHDIDDAIRGGILREEDLPRDALEVLGWTHSARIGTMVRDVIVNSAGQSSIRMGEAVGRATDALREFLLERVYVGSAAKREERKAKEMVAFLYQYYVKHPQEIPSENIRSQDPCVAARDYVAGMTDRYAIYKFEELFVPRPWHFT